MLPDKFYGKKVLAIFRCGSTLFGVEGERSDKDYIVILENYKDIIVDKRDGVDYFLFGLERFKQALRFDNSVLDYFLIWIDNTLLAKANLEYLDESFKDEFMAIIDIDWEQYLPVWLQINIDYFTACYEGLVREKSLYNLYRIRSLIENYQNTGTFTYFLSDADRELIVSYKNRQEYIEVHRQNFHDILIYLKTFLKEELNHGSNSNSPGDN